MVNSPIYINATASISVLGSNSKDVWKNLLDGQANFSLRKVHSIPLKVASLYPEQNDALKTLKNERKLNNSLDKTTLMAIQVGRQIFKDIDIPSSQIGVNIGSSRGATESFENAHKQFIDNAEVPFMTSPITTLGNVASNVAQDLSIQGPAISHSITCSSALHALLNGYAFLQSGMLEHFIVGGSEAPLTDFTIAQMQALKLYSPFTDAFPCKSLDYSKKVNTLVLGEAASMAYISKIPTKNSIKIAGIGYATEQINHSIAISSEAQCLKQSMDMALENAHLNEVDAIVMHAPGTIKGDISELNAIKKTFNNVPALTTNKFLIGHTFGASGAMSLEMAVLMLQNNHFISNPFYKNQSTPENLNTIMVNAVGFGGNAVSVILKN